jgi:hypothetical protein
MTEALDDGKGVNAMHVRRWLVRFAITLAVFGDPGLMAATVEGTVVDDRSGQPVLSAIVTAFEEAANDATATSRTNEGGRFVVEGLALGEYRLEVTHPESVPTIVHLSVSGDRTLVVRLGRLGAITGRVLVASDEIPRRAAVFAVPVTSVDVDSVEEVTARMVYGSPHTTVSATGRFEIPRLLPGRYKIVLVHGTSPLAGLAHRVLSGGGPMPSRVEQAETVLLPGKADSIVDFFVSTNDGPSAAVSGRVELPEPGTAFRVSLISDSVPFAASASTETAIDGSFRFEGVEPGIYALLAVGPITGRGPMGSVLGGTPWYGRANLSVGGQDIENAVISVEPGSSVQFTLEELSGQSIAATCAASTILRIASIEDWGAPMVRDVPLSPASKLLAAGLAPGRYRVDNSRPESPACTLSPATIDVQAGSSVLPLTLTPGALGSIEGKVVALSPEWSNVAAVVLIPAQDSYSPRIAIPDENSEFRFAGLVPGRYRLATRHIADDSVQWFGETSQMFDINVSGGESPTLIDIPGPTIAP